MAANIITATDPDMVYRLSSGASLGQQALDYFRESYNNFVNRASQLGQQFVQNVQNMFNYYNNSNIIENTKAVLADAGMITGEDVIYRLNETTIHNPGFLMRRYVMAEPTIYEKYENNRCVGYNDEWFNPDPYEKDPYMREDYLRVVDGLIRYDEDDNPFTTFFSSDLSKPLTVKEKFIIQDAWDILQLKMAKGIDPTDPDMGELG